MKLLSRTTKLIWLILFLLAILACAPGDLGFALAYERDLANNYSVWAADVVEQACIVKKEKSNSNSGSCVVNAMVFAYGWNERYIISKQYPEKEDSFQIDKTRVNWYIVDMNTNQVYGPMTENEYLEMRNTLSVPTILNFTDEIEPYNTP